MSVIKTIYTDPSGNVYCFTCAVNRIISEAVRMTQHSYNSAGIIAIPDYCVVCDTEI